MAQQQPTRSPVPLRKSLSPEELAAMNNRPGTRYAAQVKTPTSPTARDDVWPPRMPNSTIRYQGAPRIIAHPDQVQKMPRKPREPKTTIGERYTEEPQKGRLRSTFTAHPLLYIGIGMVITLTLWVVGSWVYAWSETKWNDITYGRPRTFQIDYVVGHNDSPQHPSHFVAINLNGRVQVIEEPGGEGSHAKIYVITQLYGQDASLAPITLTFADTQHNGKPEMLIHVQESTIMYLNQNGQFVPQPQQ